MTVLLLVLMLLVLVLVLVEHVLCHLLWVRLRLRDEMPVMSVLWVRVGAVVEERGRSH